MKFQAFLICAFLGLACPLAGQAADPDAEIQAFIAMLKAGKSSEAVDKLYSGNPWMSNSSDAIQNVRTQLGSLDKMVGKLRNHEKLQDIEVGARFRYVSYLAAFDRQPVRFIFEFYKPEDTWMLFSFSFDDELDDDVEKSARAAIGGG